MAYETLIGLRYIYRGKRSRRAQQGLGISILVSIAGAAMFLSSGEPSTLGAAIFEFGALSAVLFGLLCLFSVYSTVSVFGVVLGVTALVVVTGVTSGFQQQFRDKVLGVNAHVLVQRGHGLSEYREVEEIARKLPHVIGVQPFIFEEMLITRGTGELSGIALKGIDPKLVDSVLDISQHMTHGKVSVLDQHPVDEPPPIIIGRELGHKLHAKVGDVVTVVSPLSGIETGTWTATRPPKSKKFTVRGIFYAGFDEYDRRLAYVELREAQDFLEQGDVVRGVEMKLDDVDQAAAVAALLEKRLGKNSYIVMDWYDLNSNLFTALTLQKVVLVIVLTLIIIVAAANIVASLTMMVLDKTKEIAIIRSMGATSGSIALSFVIVGLTIGSVGCALGLGFGLLSCYVISHYGYPLDPTVYLIDKLPIQIHPVEILMLTIITIVICFFATLYPALKASALHPVDGLRYE